MTSTVQDIARKRDGNQKALETVLVHGRASENGTKLNTFCEEEMAERLPKNIARTTKMQLDGCDKCYLRNICQTIPLFSEFVEDQTNEHGT